MRFRLLVGCLTPVALAVFPGVGASQQVAYGDTIVEVVGLRSWSVEALEGEVQRHLPGGSLASSACAVILRDSVGFADAAASVTSFAGSDTTWVLLAVVEPADSALVRYDTEERRPIPIPAEWEALLEALAAHPGMVGELQLPEVLLDGARRTLWGAVPGAALELRERIRARDSARDRELAYELLRSSSDPAARQLAALVASNFPDEDRTWHLLARGMIAGSDAGSSMAVMIFGALARSRRFSVDWSGGVGALEAILGGTNLFAYSGVLDGLVETGIDPELSRRLARRNPNLLLDHALAESSRAFVPARRFLEHAGAPDPDDGRAEVLDWIGR